MEGAPQEDETGGHNQTAAFAAAVELELELSEPAPDGNRRANEAAALAPPDHERPALPKPIDVQLPTEEDRRARAGKVLANIYHDPEHRTVTLLLDEQHTNAVIDAVRALAATPMIACAR